MDTETTSTDPNLAELVGLSFSYKPHHGHYIPVPENQEEARALILEFKPVFESENIEKIGQNIKYDIIMLSWYGIQVKGKLTDTMLAHYVLDPDTRHNMDILAENYLNYQPLSITELIGKKGKGQGTMRDVELALITEYASEDADITLQLSQVFQPLIQEAKCENLLEDMEYPLVYVLADMEKEGVKIDQNALEEFSIELETSLKGLEKEIWKEAGTPFNIASPKQLGEILFDKLKLDPKAKKTKTGQYQTGEDVLTALGPLHPIVGSILDFRSLQKLKSTYVDALPTLINPKTGRIHTSYNQAVASTGRLSSNNPNLQNIPIRTEKGREVRKAFIPRDQDHILVSADYSQIELRIIAEISKDPAMMEAFTQNLDIHAATASRVYGVPLDQVDSTMRRNAKSVNFGIIYGQSAFGLSQNLGIPRKEAAEIIQQYFEQYPLIKSYMDNTILFAREHGYVETLMKRRRYLRDILSSNQTVRGFAERNAINAPIQGSAADLIKLAMIGIFREFNKRGLKSKMTMQVHDELVFDVPKEELEIVKPIIQEHMKNAIPTKVPIVVELGYGNNWLEAH
jgi:DNA polymerase-1